VNDKPIAGAIDILSTCDEDDLARQVWEICHWIEGPGEETHIAACTTSSSSSKRQEENLCRCYDCYFEHPDVIVAVGEYVGIMMKVLVPPLVLCVDQD